jgi:hypothetical protein
VFSNVDDVGSINVARMNLCRLGEVYTIVTDAENPSRTSKRRVKSDQDPFRGYEIPKEKGHDEK